MRTIIVRTLSAAVLTGGFTLAAVVAAVPAQADPINSTSPAIQTDGISLLPNQALGNVLDNLFNQRLDNLFAG